MIDDFGELNFLFSRLALIARQFQSYMINKYPTNFDTIENFQQLINETMIQQINLLNDYSSWSDCESSRAIKEDVIPYITADNPYVVQYTNLYTFTGKVISNVINI